ncbi:hypothetical protein PUN28_017638 [Cardiocondyla obscurior]|uniref:Uncharacterized protein n=1 Tax=Cardiocondyla obscurior TaxID=286306 RepID=A0AAW2EIF7_9HYME
MLFGITTAVCNRGRGKKGKKKRFNIPQWRIRIDPSARPLTGQRKSSGSRRISLVHVDSAPVCRPHRKSTAGSRKSRFSRPPPPPPPPPLPSTFVRASVVPGFYIEYTKVFKYIKLH